MGNLSVLGIIGDKPSRPRCYWRQCVFRDWLLEFWTWFQRDGPWTGNVSQRNNRMFQCGGGLFHQNDQSILSFSSLGDWGDDKWYTIRLPHLPNASSIFDSCCGSQLTRNSSDEKLVLRPSALEGTTRVVNLLESKARRVVKHCHKSY